MEDFPIEDVVRTTHPVPYLLELLRYLDKLDPASTNLQLVELCSGRPESRPLVATLLYGFVFGTASLERLAQLSRTDIALRHLTSGEDVTVDRLRKFIIEGEEELHSFLAWSGGVLLRLGVVPRSILFTEMAEASPDGLAQLREKPSDARWAWEEARAFLVNVRRMDELERRWDKWQQPVLREKEDSELGSLQCLLEDAARSLPPRIADSAPAREPQTREPGVNDRSDAHMESLPPGEVQRGAAHSGSSGLDSLLEFFRDRIETGASGPHSEAFQEILDDVAYAPKLSIDEIEQLRTPQAGAALEDRFHIRRAVGRGGYGSVFEAWDSKLKRRVAIKLVNLEPEVPAKRARRLRWFLEEAEILARLKHPNIVQIFDYGAWKALPFLVLEFVEGQSLQEYLDQNQSLMPEEAVDIMLQVCGALEHAHVEQHITHRDLKPPNILLTSDGHLKVIDFGIASQRMDIDAASERDKGLNLAKIQTTTAIAGTLPYMAPEQLAAEDLDERADVWAAGIVLYQLLFGRVPYPHGYRPGEEAVNGAGLPESLATWLRTALSPDREHRFSDAREMRTSLTEVRLKLPRQDNLYRSFLLAVQRYSMHDLLGAGALETRVHRSVGSIPALVASAKALGHLEEEELGNTRYFRLTTEGKKQIEGLARIEGWYGFMVRVAMERSLTVIIPMSCYIFLSADVVRFGQPQLWRFIIFTSAGVLFTSVGLIEFLFGVARRLWIPHRIYAGSGHGPVGILSGIVLEALPVLSSLAFLVMLDNRLSGREAELDKVLICVAIGLLAGAARWLRIRADANDNPPPSMILGLGLAMAMMVPSLAGMTLMDMTWLPGQAEPFFAFGVSVSVLLSSRVGWHAHRLLSRAFKLLKREKHDEDSFHD